ncbi:MAG: AI-2E family transporter [Crocinitomicaceae bacterium]|nr:AI-2E family transporter [Crocinitomicaceae bacterium]
MKINKTTSWLLLTALIIAALVVGQQIILPFIIALLIWFIVKKIRNLIDKYSLIQKYIPSWVKTLMASMVVFSILFFAGKILISNIENLSMSYKLYGENISKITTLIHEVTKIDVHTQIVGFIESFIPTLLESLFNSISDLIGNMVMIIFYVVFLVLEESLFQSKIKLIFPDKQQFIGVTSTLKKIDKSLSGYIALKSLISLMTSTCSYIILASVGIDSPIFWAFLIFMFNFIPSVGPIMGTVFPALFSLLQFGEFVPFLIILIGVGTVALLVGSLVEPKLMGNTLNISPLVAILSLAIWGSIWGVVGMLLSVPITVAMIIVMSQFPQTRSIAILLSEKGRV